MMHPTSIIKHESTSSVTFSLENNTSRSKAKRCFNCMLVCAKNATRKTRSKFMNVLSSGKDTKKSLQESANRKWKIIKNVTLLSIKTVRNLLTSAARFVYNKQVIVLENVRKHIPEYKSSTQNSSKPSHFRKLKNMGCKGFNSLVNIAKKCIKKLDINNKKTDIFTITLSDKTEESNSFRHGSLEVMTTTTGNVRY